jgi:hypothetical protein
MEVAYPDPFASEPISDLSDVGALADELERQAALLTAVATDGPRIETASPAHRPSPSAKESVAKRKRKCQPTLKR